MSGVTINNHLQAYLEADEVIDWHHPNILELAQQLAFEQTTAIAIAQGCLEWVRDRNFHSFDYQTSPVIYKAYDELRYWEKHQGDRANYGMMTESNSSSDCLA